ncbi:MAG TPA: hypothetical protein VFG29_03165 [Syntrophales bacterium]|nr:hypothetical protein [Syntrophales bacterium]
MSIRIAGGLLAIPWQGSDGGFPLSGLRRTAPFGHPGRDGSERRSLRIHGICRRALLEMV